MLSHFCTDLAVQYVKTIVDCNRCGLCDKLDGARMRFTCGHTACVDCVATECPTCSPLMDPSSNRPQSDEPLTERVKHASELLTSFEDEFNVNVYLRHRISERLKIEKELFPECIQAPSQYFNKRKSLNVSCKNKENRIALFFPGEEISPSKESTMNKSKNYVQAWLNKQSNILTSSQTRTPFSDLNVNAQHKQTTSHSRAGKQKENSVNLQTQPSSRKRSRLKQPSKIKLNLENYLKPVEKGESKKVWMSAKRLKQDLDTEHAVSTVQGKNNCDESGIVIDDDCFTIEDTQDQNVDKDKLALLAVANADSQFSESVVVIEDIHDQKIPMNNVPFYKKSYLCDNLSQCIDDEFNVVEPKMHENDSGRFSDISITVESKSFITTINVVDCNPVKKQSTTVQTDLGLPFLGFEQPEQKEEAAQLISKIQEYINNEAMVEEAEGTDVDTEKTTCIDVILEKKGGKINVDQGDNKMVTDQLSEHDYGILSELRAGQQKKRRTAARGVTPDSNNSSDKENYDPNRRKRNDGKKKRNRYNLKKL